MFPLINHNETNPKIENCIDVCRHRIRWGNSIKDVLGDKILVEDFGAEIVYFAYRAAEILEKDLLIGESGNNA